MSQNLTFIEVSQSWEHATSCRRYTGIELCTPLELLTFSDIFLYIWFSASLNLFRDGSKVECTWCSLLRNAVMYFHVHGHVPLLWITGASITFYLQKRLNLRCFKICLMRIFHIVMWPPHWLVQLGRWSSVVRPPSFPLPWQNIKNVFYTKASMYTFVFLLTHPHALSANTHTH